MRQIDSCGGGVAAGKNYKNSDRSKRNEKVHINNVINKDKPKKQKPNNVMGGGGRYVFTLSLIATSLILHVIGIYSSLSTLHYVKENMQLICANSAMITTAEKEVTEIVRSENREARQALRDLHTTP